MSKLQEEIKQAKPFESLHQELWLNLSRTAAALGHEVEQTLRPHGLSPTQYNVLRILRGAGENGLVQHEVGARLVAEVPDVPRILSRMETAGWVKRTRGTSDRRVVQATLTPDGMKLVNDLDDVMRVAQNELFEGMSDAEMNQLCELLVTARRRAGRATSA
jgi:DNA-binding MarR family transcriptional regulator